MKKVGLLLVGIIAAVVLLSNLGSLVGMIISLGILYVAAKKFLQTDSTSAKVIWGIIGFIALSMAVANMPAILGLVAIYILYLIYKKWDEQDKEEADDPFTNFEKQWDELKRN